MKIGFSFGRCIRDIVNGEVDYDDVAWIISGTAMKDIESAKFVIQDYMYRSDYLGGLDEATCIDVGLRLYKEGKVLQPRLEGVHRHMIPEGALWADMFPTNMANNVAAKSAWDAYRFMIHMTTQVPEDVEEHWKGNGNVS